MVDLGKNIINLNPENLLPYIIEIDKHNNEIWNIDYKYKHLLFSIINKLHPNKTLINCNSSLVRFIEDNENYENIIYINVNNCDDFNILNILKKSNNLIIL